MAAYSSRYVGGFVQPNHQPHTWNQGQFQQHQASAMFPVVQRQSYSFLADLLDDNFLYYPLNSAPIPSPPHAPPFPAAAPPAPSPSPSPPFPPPAPEEIHLGWTRKTERAKKSQVYVRKPLNAFMLFMKERRATVGPGIRRRGSGAVNSFLGSVWKSLSRKEKEKYFQAAEEERALHQQRYPGWSTKDNYGKRWTKAEKRKLEELREGREEASPQELESDESPPSKWMMLTPKYRKKFKNYFNSTEEMERPPKRILRSSKQTKCDNV